MPDKKEFVDENGRKSWLINDGDWVESCTYAYADDLSKLPDIAHYKEERERRGFGDLPDESDPHPAHFAAFRGQTERQVRLLHRLWPARNREKVFARYSRAMHKIAEHENDRADLRRIMGELGRDGTLGHWARGRLSSILQETAREHYREQKAGLPAIFNRAAAREKLNARDLMFARTVVREFEMRADRKIRKHEARMHKAAAKLDY
jgi:hypothetical protein